MKWQRTAAYVALALALVLFVLSFPPWLIEYTGNVSEVLSTAVLIATAVVALQQYRKA
jgi:hypothetical protein